jgi:hypothetical protein
VNEVEAEYTREFDQGGELVFSKEQKLRQRLDDQRRPPIQRPESLDRIRVSDIETQRVRWLWPGHVALGMLNGLVGDGGLGKSTFTLHLAARVSRGQAMPDGSAGIGPANVLVLSAEDHPNAVIKPRLLSAGADTGRVFLVNIDESGYQLSQVAELEDAIVQDDVKLVIIDPLSAFLGKTDSYKDSELRALLAPLRAVAERTGAAILFVAHLKKGTESTPLHRIAGSIGLGAALRVVSLVAEDREGGPEDRLLVPVKNNLAKQPAGRRFSLIDSHDGNDVAVITWGDETSQTAAELLAPLPENKSKSKLEQAMDFLRALLADGPVPVKTAEAAAKGVGISERTLQRARSELGVKSRPRGAYQEKRELYMPVSANVPTSNSSLADTDIFGGNNPSVEPHSLSPPNPNTLGGDGAHCGGDGHSSLRYATHEPEDARPTWHEENESHDEWADRADSDLRPASPDDPHANGQDLKAERDSRLKALGGGWAGKGCTLGAVPDEQIEIEPVPEEETL